MKNVTTNTTTTTTSSSSFLSSRHSIGPDDVIEVQGRYLVNPKTNERFLVQGMAFPIAPRSTTNEYDDNYDEQGWIAVLEQLAHDTDINTVRLYQLNCTLPKYDGFFQRAAELGVYVIVPLTTVSGDGVLNRDRRAPHCYNQTLYEYGKTCMDLFTRHPNILAGMIGNEVMNSIKTWPAAPCIKAYARDLKVYSASLATSTTRTSFPLVYAAQHDSPSASILTDTAMKLTMDYLSCKTDQSDAGDVDIFGINVESWCSSLQTFAYDEDGITESSYHALYETLQDAPIPLFFSEMGCSQILFNRDNGLERYVRDWRQVPVVLQDMVDTFSGFCAYTYDGNMLFRMMDGREHWNGHDVLQPSADYDNFRYQLHAYHEQDIVVPVPPVDATNITRPPCAVVRQQILEAWKVSLYPMGKMPMYSQPFGFLSAFGLSSYFSWDEAHWNLQTILVASLIVLALIWVAWKSYRNHRHKNPRSPTSKLSDEDLGHTEPTEKDSLLPKA